MAAENPLVNEEILEKIRKVQGYLKSDNVNEAAVAAAKLSEMLLRYNLTLEDIPGAQKKADPFVNVKSDTETLRLPQWRELLANSIAKANLCKCVTTRSGIAWLGRESNVEVAQFIYETCANDLLRIADGLWYAIKAALPGEDLVHGKQWKHDFMMGAADGVKQKLEAERARLQQEANVNALIIRNSRELAVFTHQQYPHLTSGSYYHRGNNAYALGVQTGRNIEFKSGVGSGGAAGVKRLGRG